MFRINPTICRLLVIILLAGGLAGCNLPAGTPTGAVLPPTPTITLPAALTIIPKVSDETSTPPPTVEVVLPSLAPQPSATPEPLAVDPTDPGAIIAGVRSALQNKDASFFAAFTPANLPYINYIEGNQPVHSATFLADLKDRLAASNPQCSAYGTYEQDLQIWTTGWSPAWQITEMCYQGCNTLSPPQTSSTAAFFFHPNDSGVYQLSAVWLNDDTTWRSVYQVQMHACDEPYQPPAAVIDCPGAPATRLNKGWYAYASTDNVTANRVRSAPGTGSNILGLLPAGDEVQILDGPQCVQGFVWWKVKLIQINLTGWTAEGQGSDYWLVPCSGSSGCKQP